MITLDKLSDKNKTIKIIAIDHRESLLKILDKQEVTKFKTLCVREFAPYSTAALLDREYGNQARLIAQGLNLGVIWTAEQTGYVDSPEGRDTVLYKEFDAMHEANNLKVASIKLLLYYNRHSTNAKKQLEVARHTMEESHKADLPLLIEPITYPVTNKTYTKSEAILNAVEDLKEFADILKIEFPIDMDKNNMQKSLITAEPLLKKINEMAAEKPWILLSRGIDYSALKEAIKLSKRFGCRGYAVGRSIWQEVGNYKTWEEKEKFIKTTAKQRMKELSDIYDVSHTY